MGNGGNMKALVIIVVVVILIGAVMFATNPTKDDFNNYLENKANRNIKKYADGSKDALDELIYETKPPANTYSESQFKRKNFYIFSIYDSDSLTLTDGTLYLGLFKAFLKLE